MKNKVDKFKDRIGRYIAYFNHAKQYQGMVAYIVYFILIVKAFDVIMVWYWYVLIALGILVGSTVFGYLDTKYGFRKHQHLDNEHNQPIRMETYRMVKEMYHLTSNKRKK